MTIKKLSVNFKKFKLIKKLISRTFFLKMKLRIISRLFHLSSIVFNI